MGYALLTFPDPDALSQAVATRWAGLIAAAPAPSPPFTVALPGGRIARTFLALAASDFKAQGVARDALHLFWGDERCVPAEDPESNYRLACDAFLSRFPLGASQIHRIAGELDPAFAAAAAEKELRAICPTDPHGWPVLDLVLLGMGEDGHVASLFPGGPSGGGDSQAVYVPVTGPKPPPRRISLTYGAIAAAREVWVLASGTGKEHALRRSLAPDGDTPLARVVRSRSQTQIFTDIAGT